MQTSDWIKRIHIPPSIKGDVVFLPALFVFNCFTFSAWTKLGHVAMTEPWLLLVWLYGLFGLVPLVWRDKAPLIVFVTQLVLAVIAWKFFPYYVPVVGIPVALYAVSVHCGKSISLLALLASFIPNGLAAAVAFRVYPNNSAEYTSSFVQNAVFLALLAAGAWGAGRLTQTSQRHVKYLEREREMTQEATREAIAKERERIARDLHDIVSHAVTMIVLQAAGAAAVADIDLDQAKQSDLDQVKQSLANIETTGQQAMAELRRLLGVLDGSDSTDHAQGVDVLGPQPGLADLTALLASFRATGRRITDHVEGTPRDLDPSVGLAAYRIVQEGLTNALKHASKDANPQLRLVWEAHSLRIQVDNCTSLADVHGEGPSVGRGLAGLRERAHAVGGRLDAGPHHETGYRLSATLPLATSATHHGVSASTTVSRAYSQGWGD